MKDVLGMIIAALMVAGGVAVWLACMAWVLVLPTIGLLWLCGVVK